MPTSNKYLTGLNSDYLEAVKDYTPQAQRKTLWETFLTGTQEQYKTMTDQIRTSASYDISNAYANYKQQQLQLKMNEQLGAGLKQQLSSQLTSEYGIAYSGIKQQEYADMSTLAEQYKKDLIAGENTMLETAKNARVWDELLVEWSKKLKGEQFLVPENFRDESGNLTEEAKLWYYDVMEGADSKGNTFYDWVRGEETSDKYDLETREEVYEAYRKNPELFTTVTTGLTPNFDVTVARKNQQERFYNTPINSGVSLSGKQTSANSGVGDNFEVKYDGKTYKVEKGARANNNTQGELTTQYKKRYGDKALKDGVIITYKGELYIYIENNDNNKREWNKIQGRKLNKSDMNALTTALGLNKAKHTEDGKKKSTKSSTSTNMSMLI